MHTEQEHPACFPSLRDPWPRPPDLVPVAHDAFVGAISASPPVDGGPQTDATITPPMPTGGQAQTTAEAAEAERIRLLGRAGRNPTLTARDDPRKTKATFPLAVRENSEKSVWYTIVAFGSRSQQVMAVVQQGNSYEVIGYSHETPYEGKDGTPRVKREIYAASVIPR
jgi:hypothetical protein